jgi:hypothetical protein
MQIPKVSIIVPCYNQSEFLSEALLSVFQQTHANWECLIINDGSEDNTEAIARNWESKDSRFKYLGKENGGVGSARNLGIKKAVGKYILPLDADDKFDASFIFKAVNILENNSEIGIVSSWGTFFEKEEKFQVYKSNAKSISDLLFHNGINMGFSLFRKDNWEKAGKYNCDSANGYEDWEFMLRICALGLKIHIIEEVLFFYRQHIISRRKEMNLKYQENKKFIFMNNKEIYFDHYEELIDRFLNVSDLEKKEMNKFKETIDFRLGNAILKPLRAVKWACINFFKN